MTYDQLEMLESIVELGSFKAASVALHKSQPSLSVGIKKLEEEFTINLFDRSEYHVKLTDQGKIFYRWAKESLESFRNLEVIGKEMGQKDLEPTLTVVLDPLVQYDDLQGVFQTCLGPKSPTELTLRSEILDKGMEMVLAQEADFAIGPILKEDSRIESLFFRQVELIPVALKSIAQDYKKFPQIVVRSPTTQGSISKGPKCYVSDHDMKYKLILGGYGWGRLAKHEITSKNLVKINDSVVKSFNMDLYVMRNKHKAMGPLGKLTWAQLKKG